MRTPSSIFSRISHIRTFILIYDSMGFRLALFELRFLIQSKKSEWSADSVPSFVVLDHAVQLMVDAEPTLPTSILSRPKRFTARSPQTTHRIRSASPRPQGSLFQATRRWPIYLRATGNMIRCPCKDWRCDRETSRREIFLD